MFVPLQILDPGCGIRDTGLKRQNPKFEYRNPKQIQNLKVQMFKTKTYDTGCGIRDAGYGIRYGLERSGHAVPGFKPKGATEALICQCL